MGYARALHSNYVFVTCQAGAEGALKQEVAREHPGLAFAFSRPGFVTFKSVEELEPNFELRSIFARAYGLSFGKVSSVMQVQEFCARFPADSVMHVVERERHPPGEEPLGFVPDAQASKVEAELVLAFPQAKFGVVPPLGVGVVTLVCVEAEEWWVGFHFHSKQHSPFPGGKARIVLPDEAPSRAYLKMEEAMQWSAAPVRAGDNAVELGSAPGGACYAWLQRGLNVVGIDPAEMAPIVKRHPQFRHVAYPVAQLERTDLPAQVHWFALDMNVSPDVSLRFVEKIIPAIHESLLGVFLTFKLNNWKYAKDLPVLLERIKDLGFSRVRAVQLASNRREILVYGLTRLGAGRGKG